MPKHSWLILALLVALVGCQTAAPPSIRSGDATPAQGQAVSSVPPLSGVLQPPDRSTQALPSDVINAATVTLIDPSSNVAVTTAMTNATGNFTLQFSGGFTASLGSIYVLEAFKGLANNSPGYYAPRFRTIVQLGAGGWTSITGSTIYINALTTAIAITDAFDGTMTAGNTIEKVTPPATLLSNAFQAVGTGHPDSEVYQLSSDISNYLTNNIDPVLSVSSIAPTITSFSPTSGGAGTVVTVYGTGFNASPGSTTVTFNGVAANVIYVAPRLDTPGQSRLAVVAPGAFTTGKIRVSTPIGTVLSVADFTTNVPTISSLSVATGSVGTTVTLTGTNFDLNASNDIVRFNGVLAPVTAASATSLTVAVPAGATTGNVVVTTNAGASNGLAFAVYPNIVSMNRTSGPIGGTVVLTGTNFDGVVMANNLVRFNGILATVTAATSTSITCSVPAGAATGPVTVTIGGNTSTAITFYVVPTLGGTGTL